MGSSQDVIQQKIKRTRWFILGGVLVFGALLLAYFSWLFLLKGFTVKVLPAEAAISQHFSVKNGVGFFIENRFYLLGSQANIEVSAQKFSPQQVPVKATQDSTLTVTLQPLPAQITIATTPSSAQTQWHIDAQLVAQSAEYAAQWQPGTYQLTAAHPFYKPAMLTLQVAAGDEIQQTLALEPVQGQLVLASRPQGAEVMLDGKAVGKTPLQLSVAGGRYQVQLQLQGYEPVNEDITVSYEQTASSREYFLQPEQARLNVTTAPQDGILLVNGKSAVSPLSLDANKPYTIRYEKAGYIAQSQQVTLAAGAEQSLAFTLQPELGQVHFTANQSAEVYINGKAVGTTPLQLALQTTSQNIEFRKAGYRTVTRTITPSAQQTQRVQAELLTEFAARRQAGQQLFAETLGIQFIAVQPKAFTMGSAANETDRGRNEQQVQVSFSRNIWVSAHEITEAQYAAYRKQGAASTLPVTQVSWLDAVSFTNWLSEQEGLTPFYVIQNGQVTAVRADSQGYRLLTEAEWEFIAKHNRRSARTTFVWGNEARLRAKQGNFADASLQGKQTFVFSDYNDGFAGKAPVGSFKAERAGFFDLDGNVREWVHDAYAVNVASTTEVLVDYLGAANGQGHVIKGASYKSGRIKELRASIRAQGNEPADDVGFRIARYQ